MTIRAEGATGASVAGIGTVGFGRFEQSTASLADQAIGAALRDCGLERQRVDGLLVHIGSPRGLDYDEVARLLALDVRFASQTWSHGRFCGTLIQHAAMAVNAGLADYVVCVAAFRNLAFTRHGTPDFPQYSENFREGGGPHAETPHAGLIAPIGGAALAAQRYLHRYGIASDKLAAVALAQRNAARLNPLAASRAPLSLQAYLDSPFVAEPLRRHDCSLPVDTAVAVIVTTEARAIDLAKPPVTVLGCQGLAAGPDEFVFGLPELGVNTAWHEEPPTIRPRPAAFEHAGIDARDLDTLHCYDGFAPQVWWTLERLGVCQPGEAADWVQGGRIELGGELPINTSGGHLSEGHSNGWGQTLEIVRQLRGEAGPRQIPDCRLAAWATTFGDAIVYGRS
ncbi:MAG: thiolase family protein [Lautropia sp.]